MPRHERELNESLWPLCTTKEEGYTLTGPFLLDAAHLNLGVQIVTGRLDRSDNTTLRRGLFGAWWRCRIHLRHVREFFVGTVVS